MSFAPIAGWITDPARADPVTVEPVEGEHLLVPLLDSTVPTVVDQLSVASTLAASSGATLRVLDPVSLPDRSPPGPGADADGGLLDWALDRVPESVSTRGTPLVGRRVVRGVRSFVDRHDVDTVVLPGRDGGRLRRSPAERIAAGADADVVVVSGRPGYDDVSSILLPVAGGPHSEYATAVARRVAEGADAWIDAFHVVRPDAPPARRERAEAIVDAARDRLGSLEDVDTWVYEADDPAAAVVEQSEYYDLTVLGAPTGGRLHRFVFGSTPENVRAEARSLVLMGRTDRADRALLRE